MIQNLTKDLKLAVKCLQNGELVAFPSETVYGLGADARNDQAIARVFQVKGRPSDHPLILHIASVEQLPLWATDIPDSAWLLAAHFWPGPLTLILNKHATVSKLITGGQETIAIRIPNHPLTLDLLTQFGSAIVGPSANKYGRVSPTTATHVAADLGNEVSAILDGGACSIGIESTIVHLASAHPVIMRQGSITAQQLSSVLGCNLELRPETNNTVRTSGSHESHYAPLTPAYLLTVDEITQQITLFAEQQQNVSVLSFAAQPDNISSKIFWQQLPKDPQIYAHDLYANLRAHDQLGNAAILIEQVPPDDAWLAIMDRLIRASTKE